MGNKSLKGKVQCSDGISLQHSLPKAAGAQGKPKLLLRAVLMLPGDFVGLFIFHHLPARSSVR